MATEYYEDERFTEFVDKMVQDGRYGEFQDMPEICPPKAIMVTKMDKDENFMGRWALERAEERGMNNMLVGFKMSNGVVPVEGAAIVLDGKPAGRVTSARYSEQLGHAIGLAWVPASLGEEGTEIEIKYDRDVYKATVVHGAFYDPDQERLRA